MQLVVTSYMLIHICSEAREYFDTRSQVRMNLGLEHVFVVSGNLLNYVYLNLGKIFTRDSLINAIKMATTFLFFIQLFLKINYSVHMK